MPRKKKIGNRTKGARPKASRLEPLERKEFDALVKAALTLSGVEERQASYATMLEALWALGCHPSVLARKGPEREKHGPTFRQEPGVGWVCTWKRPKTSTWCSMPIETELKAKLAVYFDSIYQVGRVRIYRIVSEAGKKAGLGNVTPLTLRHTAGWRVFRLLGPDTAKRSLGVGDRAFEHYTALSDRGRLKALKEAM